MEATIEVTGLRKRFGSQQALDGMTFTVMPGRVTGVVGPNGAGKSTTMRVIAGLYIVAANGVRSLPLSPWQGLGVLALWAFGAVTLGALFLRFRDA